MTSAIRTVKYRSRLLFIATLIALVIVAIIAMTMGSASISPSQIIQILKDHILSNNTSAHYSQAQAYIIWNLRFPRVLTAILAGMMLSASGVVFQAVFRNPMADPYVLGISSGASFGVALATFFGIMPVWAGAWAVPIAAWIGAMGATALIFVINGRQREKEVSLLLTGIALNFLLSAVVTLMMYLHQEQLERVLFWTMGSLNTAAWTKLGVLFIASILTIIPLFFSHREMDLLLLDEASARGIGLSSQTWRILLLSIATLLAATCVAFCGTIGFLGLMAPHIVRLIVGPGHKRLLPCSMAFGALLLLCADTLSRTVMGATELPVGVITSIAGAPVFLLLLKRQSSRRVL